jgi:hypothetical protein
MPDDALLWTHKPAPRCRPRPGEPLWSLQKDNVTWSCELQFHGESVGWEAQILRDGNLSIATIHPAQSRRRVLQTPTQW